MSLLQADFDADVIAVVKLFIWGFSSSVDCDFVAVAVAGLVGPPDFDFDFAAMADDLTSLSPVTMLSLGPPDFDFVAVTVAEFDTDVVTVTAANVVADVVAAVLWVLIVCLGLSLTLWFVILFLFSKSEFFSVLFCWRQPFIWFRPITGCPRNP
jgi:hypothetical protein